MADIGDFPFLSGGGEAADLIASFDWSRSSLGPIEKWSAPLTTTLALILRSPVAIVTLWGENGIMLYNDAYAAFAGARHPELLGRKVREAWAEVADFNDNVMKVGLAGGTLAYADQALTLYRAGRPDQVWLDLDYSPIPDGTGIPVGVMAIVVETTEMRKTADRLRESEERNRRIVEGVKDHAVFTTDRDGIVTDWTNGAEAVFQWHAHDIVGQSADVLYTLEDRAADIPAAELLTARTAGFVNDERWHLRRDGSRFFANGSVRPLHDAQGEIVGFIRIARDDTDRRAVEQSLAANEEQLRLATQAAEIGLWDLDPTTDSLFWPPIVKAMFGISADRPISMADFYAGLHPDDASRTTEAFAAALDPKRRAIYDVEYRTIGKEDRVLRWVAAKGRGIFDDQGVCQRAVGTAIDITARKASEARLKELNEHLEIRVSEEVAKRTETEDQLRQSQKLEAIGQLTGGVAHDFNNLLTVIRGSVDMLRRDGLSAEKRDKYIDAIGSTADRAAALTGQLLAFARRQALRPTLFDAGQSLSEVGDMVRTLVGSRVTLDIHLPDDPCFILADRGQFDTVLINLGINARDAMNGEGSLTMMTGPVSGIPAIRGHPPVAGDFVAMTIADTGSGISSDDLSRIFEPFFTTKQVGKGTGLGLSQVIGFAKQSGGDIRVETSEGVGTTFTLYLPRAYPDGDDLMAEDESDGSVDGAGLCVLLVEDNEQVGEFATQALKELGYDSVHAINAEQALAELQRDCARFHVVFSDVVMPGISGLELGQEIRQRYPDVPVVLTSGYSHVLAQNGKHGFELLHKPYSVEQLSRALRKAVQWAKKRQSGQ